MVSEITKQVVEQHRNTLESRRQKNLNEIAGHEADIAKLKAVNATLATKHDALEADIPAPVVAEF